MPFGMGFGELVLILLIVVVVFGNNKLPQVEDALDRWLRGDRLIEKRAADRWTRWDWFLVAATAIIATAALALFVHRHGVTR